MRNEAWILRHFLQATTLWADHIIIADQGSTDGSLEIAAEFPKVKVITNVSSTYDESRRQQLLIEAARHLPGRNIFLALDADEFFSPALAGQSFLDALIDAGPGAVIRVPWLNVNPGLSQGWIGHRNFIAAWFDNGRPHSSNWIHGQRLPVATEDAEVDVGPEAVVMHWQYTAPERMRSKHRWYVASERMHCAGVDSISLYRKYHHMDVVCSADVVPIPAFWLDWYRARGVHLTTIKDDGFHWWDTQVLNWMTQRGPNYFARDAIWDYDWSSIARIHGVPQAEQFRDPRKLGLTLIHLWLRRTQRHERALAVRAIDKIFRAII